MKKISEKEDNIMKVIETDMTMKKISENADVIYYDYNTRKPRWDIFDDQEVIAIELDNQISNGHKIPCICIYCGDRI